MSNYELACLTDDTKKSPSKWTKFVNWIRKQVTRPFQSSASAPVRQLNELLINTVQESVPAGNLYIEDTEDVRRERAIKTELGLIRLPSSDSAVEQSLASAFVVAKAGILPDTSNGKSKPIKRRPIPDSEPIMHLSTPTITGPVPPRKRVIERGETRGVYRLCLVPDLKDILDSTFYWGKLSRYEAAELLDGKPNGTYLLRDSAQPGYLFSVSFRKFHRTLHVRVDLIDDQFGFDSGSYSSDTIMGLLEHYKNAKYIFYYEPALNIPLKRTAVFTLPELCRGTVVTNATMEEIDKLAVPASLKAYLKEYRGKE